MDQKTFTQRGTFIIVLFGSFILLFTGVLAYLGYNDPAMYILLPVILLFAICIGFFYKLTITVTDVRLTFNLGFGMIRKSYLLSEIESVKPVRNPVFYGIGIKMIPHGWLYNVSGLDAVEVKFKNRKSVVRIGTDQPVNVSNYINSKLDNGLHQTNAELPTKSKYFLWGVVIILTIFIIATITILGNKEPEAKIKNNIFELSGIYGYKVNIADITSIDTVQGIPPISMRTNGYALGNHLKGYFRLTDGNTVKLSVNLDSKPFLLIKAKNEYPIYISFKDKQKTIGLFKILKK
jgi:hypothetical protein